MRILVVAPTSFEVVPCFEKFKQHSSVVFLYTGVGMVATAFTLTQYLSTQKFDLILHAGIAGGFDKNIPLGSVFQLVDDVFSELGAENYDDFLNIEQLGFGTHKIQANLPEKWQHLLPNLPKVKGITVNTVHGNASSIQKIKQQIPDAAVESMESAAVMYVCEQLGLPCLSLRSTSNYVEPRHRELWNIPLAIENLNTVLISIISELQSNN